MTERELILTDILGCSRDSLYFKQVISPRVKIQLEAILEERKKGMPLQYLLGKINFFGFDFKVDKRALIPRFETEILVDKAINIIKSLNLKKFNLLDLCTGSGCIAISIAKFFKHAQITASDISNSALDLAKENAVLNNTAEQIKFIRSDLFKNLKNKQYDIIISNPPYIPSNTIDTLDKEISFEPRVALDGGNLGLDFYQRILKDVHIYLKNRGFFIFEIGFIQTDQIIRLIEENSNLKLVGITRDYNKLDRVVIVNNG
ncbi:MAG: peptide chain release factor N(5)-glutamine methyltransferase [Candidatus Omnitrophota bacterium]